MSVLLIGNLVTINIFRFRFNFFLGHFYSRYQQLYAFIDTANCTIWRS